VDPDEAAQQLNEPRERILKALTWLKESGDIELKPSGARQRYRLCADATQRDPATLAQEMQRLFAERETRDVARLRQVLELAEHRDCLTRWVLRYFGEEMPVDCGTCTSCQDRAKGKPNPAPRALPKSPTPTITNEHVATIRGLLDARHASLRTPRQLTRYLCGITSPATTRERLTRSGAFGLLERVPFADVLTQLETMI
jgi:ATP-dependent DNA helicase RecQ